MTRLPADSFSWSRWRRFDLFMALGIACRREHILAARGMIRRHAVGWIEGERLACRPKPNSVAVMFLEGDEFTWCHLETAEFDAVFPSAR